MIFLLDSSRSMFRKETDIKNMSRIRLALYAMKNIILKKKEADKSDRYSLITFNGTINQMNDMYYSEKELLDFFKENTEFNSGTSLGEALAGALRIIVDELRKIGEKTIRILILSDGIILPSAMNPINISKIAKELGVIIDVIRFGPAKVPGNIVKRLAELTGGDYFFVSDLGELDASIEKLSKKKETAVSTIFDKKEDKSVSTELLAEIAGELLKIDDLTPEQKFKIFQHDPNKKLVCTICYSNTCMICNTNFYGCGRFCPNCLTPMHLHCAMAWADQQNKKEHLSNDKYKIFRCPHCFYLLKIPVQNVATTNNIENEMGEKIAEKIRYENALPEITERVCADPECGIAFDESEDKIIYHCKYCDSYFHQDCFENYYSKEHKCPYCHKVVDIKDTTLSGGSADSFDEVFNNDSDW
ncbi:MAG: VWA domain-containing protein [Promethearchaeota archaeon]